jgi:hypothetical protein
VDRLENALTNAARKHEEQERREERLELESMLTAYARSVTMDPGMTVRVWHLDGEGWSAAMRHGDWLANQDIVAVRGCGPSALRCYAAMRDRICAWGTP